MHSYGWVRKMYCRKERLERTRDCCRFISSPFLRPSQLHYINSHSRPESRNTFVLMQLFYLPVALNPPRTSSSVVTGHMAQWLFLQLEQPREAAGASTPRDASLLQQPFPIISFEYFVLAPQSSFLLAIPKIIPPSPHRTTRRPLTGHSSPSLTAPSFNPLADSSLLQMSRLAQTSPLYQHAHPFLAIPVLIPTRQSTLSAKT